MCGSCIPMNTRSVTDSELDGYLAHFSKGVSEDIKKYATDHIFLDSRYIFTSREGKKKLGYCTHCKTSFPMEGVIINSHIPIQYRRKEPDIAECPNCKSKCKIKSSGRGRSTMIDGGYFVYYEKSQVDPKAIVAMGIYAVRDYRGDYTKVETAYAETAIYIFKMGKSSMFKREAYYSSLENCIKIYKNYEKCKKVYSLCDNGHFAHIRTGFSLESIRNAIKDTEFKYSTWESYMDGSDLVRFFDLYSKSPCIEYLTKMGFQNLVRAKLNGEPTYSTINWKAKSMLKVLKITKKELNDIKNNKISVSFSFLNILQMSKRNNWGFSVTEAKDIEVSYGTYDFEFLQSMLKYGSMKKVTGFLSKQFDKNRKHYTWKSSVLRDWRDYIEDCKKLGLDINNESVLYPKNLYNSHQNTIAQIRLKANKELDIKINSRLKALKKYEFQSDSFLIRPAVNTSELINEGKELHHCVGTYAQKYATGATDILVIRKISELDKPYYTMEVHDNHVIQVRGLKNCKPTKEVEEFIKAFKQVKLNKMFKNKVKKSA